MKRILCLALIQIFVLIASLSDAYASERREFYNGVRCLGMGGGCTAVANDETALMVNPAGLGRLRDYYGTILDPEAEGTNNLSAFYAEDKFTQPFSLDNIKPALDAKRDTYYHAKAQVFPSFVGKNFGFGLYGSYLLDAQMSTDGTKIDTYYRSDMAFVLGYNFRFFDGRVKIGFNARVIDRIEVNNPTLSSTGALDYASIGNSGIGLGTDAGIILAAPWTWLPTVSAVVHDIGGTKFDKGSGTRMTSTNHPDSVAQDIDVGVAIFPIHGRYVRSTWTVQYDGLLTAKDEDDKAKLIHGGMELNFGDVFFLRAGYNQRYYTAGLELASENFQWQLATYGEEVGTSSAHKEDRRYVLKFALRF
jgi:hypothetical protein